ncbi:PDDEXK nuclease domain-containing protein [Streptomyces sp. NPDC002994]|uniref:PDDEXK nuclease domain-containing protein n=1 Tax=Streptomyces sp. NPDC002994 TaxID=3154441 RepID=UPI0033A28444
MSKSTDSKALVPAQPGTLPSWYGDLLGEVKESVSRARTRARRVINTELIQMHWEIGHHILARQKEEGWGTKVVDRLSADLRTTFPNQRGFSRRNLMYMHQMARSWPEPIVQQPVAQLPWGHIVTLVTRLKTRSEQDFYASNAVQQGWSRDRLEQSIAQQLHLTQGAADNNFSATIPDGAAVLQEIAKDPYRLDFLGLDSRHTERELEDAIVADIIRFLTELGYGFAFVGRQYSVFIGGDEFRIDLLFYHLKLHRYVVIELKTTAALPEHIGKLSFYTNVVDKMVRDPERDDETLGFLVVAERNKAVMQAALETSNRPLTVSTYSMLPPAAKALLPTEEDLARVVQGAIDSSSDNHGNGNNNGHA